MTPLTCGCPGDSTTTVPCHAPATQEDLFCDWCRARGCLTVTLENWDDRTIRANTQASEVPF